MFTYVGLFRLTPIAREASLTLQEAALVHADAHSAITFHHGPIAILLRKRKRVRPSPRSSNTNAQVQSTQAP